MENNNLTNDEEKSLVGILYNHIIFATTMDAFNELTADGIIRLNNLRNVLKKLLKKYDLSDKLNGEAYLALGIADFIDQDLLLKWAGDNNNKHLQSRAKYLLAKQKQN